MNGPEDEVTGGEATEPTNVASETGTDTATSEPAAATAADGSDGENEE